MSGNTAHLLICCPDQKGIVAAVSNFLFEHGGNIIQSDQHSNSINNGRFFMRVEFLLDEFDLDEASFHVHFAKIANKFQIISRLSFADHKKRMALFVSKETHCLQDLLWRWRAGELQVEIPFIISNHEDNRSIADEFQIPFQHFVILPDTKAQQEKNILSFLDGKIDFIVLARYMQVLSDGFINQYPGKIINIHHSFLPAFAGAKPYQQAQERGVKIIGATAHYATTDLDEGPIIEQNVIRVSHRDGLTELKQKGRDIERAVLFNAVKWHIEDRIIVDGNKTIVFV